MIINLALWHSDYYRYSSLLKTPLGGKFKFCQLYLRYQDSDCDITFEVDDSAVVENGFTHCDVYPSHFEGKTPTVTGTNPLYVKVYTHMQANHRFAVAFGQCFGQDWIHVVDNPISKFSTSHREELLVTGPEECDQFITEASLRGEGYGCVWVNYTHLIGSPWIVRTSRILWERSKIGVRMEVFRHPSFITIPVKWMAFDVEVGQFFRRDP